MPFVILEHIPKQSCISGLSVTGSCLVLEQNGLRTDRPTDWAALPSSISLFPRFTLLAFNKGGFCCQRGWRPGLFFLGYVSTTPNRIGLLHRAKQQNHKGKTLRRLTELDVWCIWTRFQNYQHWKHAEMSRGGQLPIGSHSWDFYVKQWEVRTQRTFRWIRFYLSRAEIRFPNLTLLFQLSHATKCRLSTLASPAAIPHYEDANAAKTAFYSCPTTSKCI